MARSGIAPWTAHQDETRGFQKVFSAARSTVDSASRGQAILGRAEQCRIRTGILVDPEEVTLRRLTLNDHRPNIDRHCTLHNSTETPGEDSPIHQTAVEISSVPIDLVWRLEADPERLTLEVGPSKLAELSAAVGSMPSRGGDFAIGPDDRTAWKSTSLWLWIVPEI